MATTAYCTSTQVQARLSADGLTYRIDDDPTVATDVIDDASTEIEEYCLLRYASSDLSASDWVAHRCAEIAAFLFCERRGNPVPRGIAAKYERTIAKLERVQRGSLSIADAAERKDAVPVLSKPRIRLDPHPRTVIEKVGSTGTPEGYTQHGDTLEWNSYII